MGLTGEAVKNFADTMNTWNDSVKKGIDDEFGRNNGMDDDLTTPPFYAIKIAPGIHHTMGGIKINTNAEVIDTKGNVIPGLYAAGETTGGIHGGNRVGGNAVCDFVVFGNIAGSNAVAYIRGEAPAPAAAAPAAAAGGAYVPGTYTAEATGMGTVKVSLTVDENAITEVVLDTALRSWQPRAPGLTAYPVRPSPAMRSARRLPTPLRRLLPLKHLRQRGRSLPPSRKRLLQRWMRRAVPRP